MTKEYQPPASKLLIIDDVSANIRLIEALTESLVGVEPIGFTQPLDALIWCETNEPDLILLDYVMPDIDGATLLPRLRALPNAANTPVIVVTAVEDREARMKALEAGATDFIIKPLDPAEFTARCRNLLALGKATRLLQRLAMTDDLTGLWNRRHFLARLGEEIDRATRFPGRPLSVAIFDLDGFKLINDVHGHGAGDIVLRRVARICGNAARSVDVVGRIGGEEFAIVMPDTDLAGGTLLCERVRAAIEGRPMTFDTTEVTMTVSAGIAEFTIGERPEKILARADEALYRAKRAGRNRVSS